tara:strand:- start:1141 stop:1398 length:258 start_codon:yes stop_codon:yes gene_type:complete
MIIEQVGAATYANGLVRVQCLYTGPDGQIKESGVIEVPGNVAAEVVTNLVNTLNSLESQLSEATSENDSEKKGNGKGKGKSKSKK